MRARKANGLIKPKATPTLALFLLQSEAPLRTLTICICHMLRHIANATTSASATLSANAAISSSATPSANAATGADAAPTQE
ncbi:unnamed protein product [Penicillium palitans]